MPERPRTPPAGGGRRFDETRWSLVQAAGESISSPTAHDALSELCRIYWSPVYAFVRCRGNDADTARDLTQGFFMVLLEKGYLKAANRERGKFRSFLLTCVKRYLSKEFERQRAQKRGGGVAPVSFEMEDAESFIYRMEPADPQTPDQVYEKQWAHTLLQRVLSRLEAEAVRSRHPERFRHLKPFLTGEEESSYRDVARELGMSESAVKVTIHRLRRRFGEMLRDEVSETVTDPALVDDEIRFLFRSLE